MSNSFYFGLGHGFLGKRAAAIARRHNATLVNYTDPGCRCGYDCRNNNCPANQRHWFEAQNRGEPFNSALQDRVLEDLRAANIRVDAHQKTKAQTKILRFAAKIESLCPCHDCVAGALALCADAADGCVYPGPRRATARAVAQTPRVPSVKARFAVLIGDSNGGLGSATASETRWS